MVQARSNNFFAISQLARLCGVPTTTLRYYEREHILAPTVRSQAGYRLYDSRAVEQLKFIRSAQAVGFTLGDIRVLLELEKGNKKSCQAEVQRLLAQRLRDVEDKMKELRRVREALGRSLDRCRRSNGECAVLKELRPKGSK